MYKYENRYTLFCYHLMFIKIKSVKTATILAYNLSNFPTQNVFWNQALHVLLGVSQWRILEATCRKWCNHITVRQLISRDSNRRLVTGYTSQYIQFTLRKQPWHSDAAWEKKIKGGGGGGRKRWKNITKWRDALLYFPDMKGLLR